MMERERTEETKKGGKIKRRQDVSRRKPPLLDRRRKKEKTFLDLPTLLSFFRRIFHARVFNNNAL